MAQPVRRAMVIGVAVGAVALGAGIAVRVLAAASQVVGTAYYVIPSHPNASDGTQYFCGSRLACGVDENRIAQGYGTRTQPFGSLREGVYQVSAYASAHGDQGPYTIHVAPGVYREHVYMAGHHDLHIKADTLGIHTGSTPGEVVVTGAEPLDERAFVQDVTYPNVWVLANALGRDGLSICKTDRPAGMNCDISKIVEVGNPDAQLSRISYLEQNNVAAVALGPGRFYAQIDQTNPDYPTTLYITTHDGGRPTEALQLEYLLNVLTSGAYEGFYRYRHCFDMEVPAEGNTIEGFTCRHTFSYAMHLAIGSNTLIGNRIYGAPVSCAFVAGFPGQATAHIIGNEISHCGFYGIRVEQRDFNTVIANNVVHSSGTGVSVAILTPGTAGAAAVFLGNNTLHGNGTHLDVTGVPEIVALNNSFSSAATTHYSVSTTGGGGAMINNNLSGVAATVLAVPPTFTVSGETTNTIAYRDAARFDFHLPPGSALIDGGTSVTFGLGTPLEYTPPGDDADFAARVAPNDIGAFEFSSVGDGIIDTAAGEQCDDGNRRAGDGCDAAGQIEPAYVFQGPLYATDSHCDCVYTVDNTGAKTPLRRLNVTTPVSMAVAGNQLLAMVDNQTGSLLTFNPETNRRQLLCTGLPVLQSLAISPVDVPGPNGVIAAGTLFGTYQHLFAINPRTCQTRDLGPVGPTGAEVIAGLDFRADGVLFGAELSVGQSESLFRIDTASGQGTTVGTIGPAFDRIGSLVFDANGVLWASDINTSSPQLVRLNPENGSIVLAMPMPVLPGGLPMSPQGLGLIRPPR